MDRMVTHEIPLPKGFCGHSPTHYKDDRLGGSHVLCCATCKASSGYQKEFSTALEYWIGRKTASISTLHRMSK